MNPSKSGNKCMQCECYTPLEHKKYGDGTCRFYIIPVSVMDNVLSRCEISGEGTKFSPRKRLMELPATLLLTSQENA
jgi:hypothetical protein